MFEDSKITKLKKDQFIEAESVAYLIEDKQKRKLTFINTCALFAFKNYVEKNKYNEEPVTNINLFRVPVIAEKYGISDLYLGNIRIDVRVSLDGNVFPIPVCHIKNAFAPDFYVVYKRTKNPLKCEAVGYIKKDDLIFDSQDGEYYYISNSILNPIEDLKSEVESFPKEEKTFYETEHKIASENFGAFLDGELDSVKSLDLIEHLLDCKECRGLFVEYSFLEDVLIAVKHYPDLQDDIEKVINESENEQNIQAEEEIKDDISDEDVSPIPVVVPIADDISSNDLDSDFTDELSTQEDDLAVQEDDLAVQEDDLAIDTDEESEEDNFVDFSEAELNFSDEPTPEESPEEDLVMENSSESEESNEIEDEYLIKEDAENDELIIENDNENEKISFADDNVIQPEEPQIVEEEIQVDEKTFEDNFIEDLPVQNSAFDDDLSVDAEPIANPSEESDVPNIDISFDEDSKEPLLKTEDFLNPDEQSVELDIVSNDETDSTISLSDILIDENSIELEAKESLQNDEELQSILNDGNSQNQNESISIDTNWNELFTNNSGTAQTEKAENPQTPENIVTDNAEPVYANEDIETLYDKTSEDSEIQSIPEELIENTIEQTAKKEKKSMNVVIIASSIVILAAVCTGGFFMANHFMNNPGNNSKDLSSDNSSLNGPVVNDMNRAMTNAFSDTNQTLNVTKLSWNKNKQASSTPELKEYLMTIGKMISDEIDNNIMSVQGYIAENPMKISILVDKNGEVKNVKVSDSCGAEAVDEMLLNSVKTVVGKNQPSMYGVTGENINLILVVNF